MLLTKKENEQLRKIEQQFETTKVHYFEKTEAQEYKDILKVLCEREVLLDLGIDNADAYIKCGDFSVFEDWLKDQEKKERKERRAIKKHDYAVAIISTIIGIILGALGNHFFTTWFGGGG